MVQKQYARQQHKYECVGEQMSMNEGEHLVRIREKCFSPAGPFCVFAHSCGSENTRAGGVVRRMEEILTK